jgi:hypothetical protein
MFFSFVFEKSNKLSSFGIKNRFSGCRLPETIAPMLARHGICKLF